MRMKNIHENTVRLIQIHCYDFTQTRGPAIDDSLGLSLYFLIFPISLNIMIE